MTECTKGAGCGTPTFDWVNNCDRCEVCGKVIHQYALEPDVAVDLVKDQAAWELALEAFEERVA